MNKNIKIKLISTGLICLILGLTVGLNAEKDSRKNLIINKSKDSTRVWDSIDSVEKEKIYDVANKYIKDNSAEEKYIISLNKKVGDNWLIFSIIPISPVTDNATLFLEKNNGVWKGVELGTAFPELWAKHPELFK